jgi:hypothetical protein
MLYLNFVVSMMILYESIVAQVTVTKVQSVSRHHIDVLHQTLSDTNLLFDDGHNYCYCCCGDNNVDCVCDYHTSFLTYCHCHHFYDIVHYHRLPRKLHGRSMRVRGGCFHQPCCAATLLHGSALQYLACIQALHILRLASNLLMHSAVISDMDVPAQNES